MEMSGSSSAPEADDDGHDDDDDNQATESERTLLLDEIEDLARSFETVQRTIALNRETYEERVVALTKKLEEAERERDALRDEVDEARRRAAPPRAEEEEARRAKERGGLAKLKDELTRQLVDAKAASIREGDKLREELKERERTIAALEADAGPLDREESPGDGGSAGDDERSALVREKNSLVDEAVKNKMAFASEKSRLQADFGSILKEKDVEMKELRQKVGTYEEERSSLRKLTVLGIKRFASFFRLGRSESNSD